MNQLKLLALTLGTTALLLLVFSALGNSKLSSGAGANQPDPADSHNPITSAGLTVDRDRHDFGAISMKDGLVSTKFQLTNTGAATANLERLTTSCMCTKAYYHAGATHLGPFGMPGHGAVAPLAVELAAGGAAELEVVYDPNAHGPAGIGSIERTVTLAAADGEIALTIAANVTP